jgi:peptidoglycan-associated lipoprotein
MKRMKTTGLLVLPVLMVACAKDAQPPMTPASGTEAPEASGAEILEQHPEKSANFSGIAISDRIRKACGLSETDSYFEFDSARVTPQADRVLGLLATCFTTGPLAGEGMKLVGHADPRGDDEYNMVLGGQRADHVSDALTRKGMGADKLAATSRGELDARGQDEGGWSKDRRVEVMIDE